MSLLSLLLSPLPPVSVADTPSCEALSYHCNEFVELSTLIFEDFAFALKFPLFAVEDTCGKYDVYYTHCLIHM